MTLQRASRWPRTAARLSAGLALLLLSGCLATLTTPDFAGFYDPAAAARHPDRNPVIVIPGFLGSRLVDEASGTVVWGAVGGDYADPATAEGARLVALSMRPGVPSPDVRPDGVLASFRYRKLSFLLRPYVETLRALSGAGYRDEDLLRQDVDFDGQRLSSFQFAYDWRLDNVDNARRLHEYILEKAAYCRAERARQGRDAGDVRFDLIAHSMGGILARYYLRYGPQPLPADGSLPALTWEGARHVERAILVAPPNAGSIKAAINMVRGVRHAPGFPFYDAVLNGTMPSGYQLFPRARHGAYVDAGDPSLRLDLLDPELWQRHGWGLAARDKDELLAQILPGAGDAGERRRLALAYQRRMLERAGQFQRALDLPATPPAGTELFLIVGDSVPTPAVIAVDPTTGEIEITQRGDGDGSVLRTSALLEERLDSSRPIAPPSAIAWREIASINRKHSRLSVDRAFGDRVVHWLLELPRAPQAATTSVDATTRLRAPPTSSAISSSAGWASIAVTEPGFIARTTVSPSSTETVTLHGR